MINLLAEYLAALARTARALWRELEDAGVTRHALKLAGPAFMRVRPIGADLFEPDPDSEAAAVVLPVRAEHSDTPESTNPEHAVFQGRIIDLVAFDPRLGDGWRLRTGNAEWLGACPPQYLDPEPVALHRSPLDWLRCGCQGLVCLARQPLDILRFLARFASVIVGDHGHAAELKAALRHPFLSPTILVRGS